MFKKPLVFVDTLSSIPQRAFDIALRYAKDGAAPLHIVDVIDDSSWMLPLAGPRQEDVRKLVEQDKTRRLEELCAKAGEAGANATFALLRGKRFVEIIREVLRGEHDVVFKTMAGAADGSASAFGGLARRLLRKCPCPVFLVHPALECIKRVVAAIALPAADDPGVTPRVLLTALGVASREGAALEALHAWEPYGESALMRQMHPEEFSGYVDTEQEIVHKAALETVALHAPAIRPEQVQIVKGLAARVIPEAVPHPESDLLVIGTVGRAGLLGVLIGNTAETILNQTASSILAVKPGGFVSPITL